MTLSFPWRIFPPQPLLCRGGWTRARGRDILPRPRWGRSSRTWAVPPPQSSSWIQSWSGKCGGCDDPGRGTCWRVWIPCVIGCSKDSVECVISVGSSLCSFSFLFYVTSDIYRMLSKSLKTDWQLRRSGTVTTCNFAITLQGKIAMDSKDQADAKPHIYQLLIFCQNHRKDYKPFVHDIHREGERSASHRASSHRMKFLPGERGDIPHLVHLLNGLFIALALTQMSQDV